MLEDRVVLSTWTVTTSGDDVARSSRLFRVSLIVPGHGCQGSLAVELFSRFGGLL
jgi:hypothetical protein